MKNLKVYRYLAYSIEILLLFILGTTPSFLPEIYGATPCLLISLAITIAVFEAEVPAMIFGLVCGALTDLGYSNSIGIYTVLLTIFCFIIGFCANNIITIKFWNILLIALFVCASTISLHFVFAHLIHSYSDMGTYFVNHYISRIVQTFVCVIPLFFINKFIYSTLD